MSSGELIIIFIVAFLVFGPERLPELGRTLGKWLLEIRKAAQDVKDHMENEFDTAGKEINEVNKAESAYPPEKPTDKGEENRKMPDSTSSKNS